MEKCDTVIFNHFPFCPDLTWVENFALNVLFRVNSAAGTSVQQYIDRYSSGEFLSHFLVFIYSVLMSFYFHAV
jgi:hypothetical protein